MKYLKIASLLVGFLALVASCGKDEPNPAPAPQPTPKEEPAIKPSASSVELRLKESKAITLSGGDGTYTVEGEADFLEYRIDAATKTLHITAKRSGSAKLTIKSGKQSATIQVNVPAAQAVSQEFGIYDETGKPLFEVRMSRVYKGEVWLHLSASSPLSKFVKYPVLQKQEEGATLQIKLTGRGLPEILPESGELTLEGYVELSNDKITQLYIPSKKWRIVTLTKAS